MESRNRKSQDDKQYSLFAQRLKMRREELGLTQDELAKKAGTRESKWGKKVKLTQPQIGKYEKLEEDGDGFPSFAKGILLAETLECSLDWLCGVSGADTPDARCSSSESVESILIRLIAAILEEEIDDLSILLDDRAVIVLENGLFDDFIVEYKEAIDFENAAIAKFRSDSPFASKATEFKQEILVKYVEKYVEMKKGNNNTQQEE